MPRIHLTDEQGREWLAIEHEPRYRDDGPLGLLVDRLRQIIIDGRQHECYRGEPQIRLKNGKLKGGTRVNLKLDSTWWHITRSDQPVRRGKKGNIYPKLENPNVVYIFRLN